MVVMKFGCGDTTSTFITDTADCLGYALNGTTYMTSGIYTQTLPNSLGCDSIITLDLTIAPVGSITVMMSGSKLVTAEQFVTYQWIYNGQAIAGATDSVYTFTQNGNYQVAVTNANGCSDTSDIYVVSQVSINEGTSALADQISVYPNPARDMVNVQSPLKVNITITDIKGRMISQVANASRFSIKELPSGLYLLRISDRTGQVIKTIKLTKE